RGHATYHDQPLLGGGGVRFSVSGELKLLGQADDVVTLFIGGPGVLIADTNTAHNEVAIRDVIDPSAITAIRVAGGNDQAKPCTDVQSLPTQVLNVVLGIPDFTLTVEVNGKAVYAPTCFWSSDDPDLNLDGGIPGLDWQPDQGYFFAGS